MTVITLRTVTVISSCNSHKYHDRQNGRDLPRIYLLVRWSDDYGRPSVITLELANDHSHSDGIGAIGSQIRSLYGDDDAAKRFLYAQWQAGADDRE